MVTLSDQFHPISMAGALPDSQMGKEGDSCITDCVECVCDSLPVGT